jgi:hypothetical protein
LGTSTYNRRGIMIYPLIKEGEQIHIVKDFYHFACGLEFNKERIIKRKILRKIKFIEIGQVTCEKCVLKLLNYE